MGRITKAVGTAWTRLRIWRYQTRLAEVAQQDRDSVERLKMAQEGIAPYGPPRGSSGGI